MPRQSLPEVWWQNGYVDIIRPRTILELGLMCGRTVLPFVVDEPILEIDYEENLPVVEEALARLAADEPHHEINRGKRFAV
jgi:N-acylneuraminate cytidylyltransferase